MSPRPTRSTSGQLPKRFQDEETNMPIVKQRSTSSNSLPKSRSASITSQAREPLPSSPSTSANMPKAALKKTVSRGPGRPPRVSVPPQLIRTPSPAPRATSSRPSSITRVQSLRVAPFTPQSKVKKSPTPTSRTVPRLGTHLTTRKNASGMPSKAPCISVPTPTPSPPPRKSAFIEPLDDMSQATCDHVFTMKDQKRDFVPLQDDAWHEMSDGIKIILIDEFNEILGTLEDTVKFLSLSFEEQKEYQEIWDQEIQRQKTEDRIIRVANKESSQIFKNGFIYDIPEYNAVQKQAMEKTMALPPPATHYITKDDVAWALIFLEQRTIKGPKQIWMKKRLWGLVGAQVGPVIERDWGYDSKVVVQEES